MSSAQTQTQERGFSKPMQAVEVIAMEMVTPIGIDAIQTAASVGAGISAYQASSSYNKRFNPMTMALVPDEALPPLEKELGELELGLTSRQQRMLRLATLPIQYLSESCPLSQPVPLLLAGPEKFPGRRSIVSDKFLKQLQVQTQQVFDLDNSYVFPHGRSGGFYVIEAAMLMLEQGICQHVMVGAVDSYLDLQLLGTLDADERILAEGVMDGFAPGEGAAFLILTLANENSQIKLLPPGVANEAGHRYSKEPYKGDGLAAAVTDALAPLAGQKVATVLAGFNGENFNAKEWGVSYIRNSQSIDPEFDIVHPADCLGDAGAALGLILAQLGIIGLQQDTYQGPILAWCSSELAQRTAMCITKG